jgi:hypothetical protein
MKQKVLVVFLSYTFSRQSVFPLFGVFLVCFYPVFCFCFRFYLKKYAFFLSFSFQSNMQIYFVFFFSGFFGGIYIFFFFFVPGV